MPKAIEFHFKSPEESSGYLLWQLTMLWQRKIKRELDEMDITHTQFVLLASIGWLLKSNEIVTQVEIARHSNTDRMMVSKVLRTLQQKGYIARQEHATDTRAKTITLTKSGGVILQKALKAVEQVDRDFFAVLKAQERPFNSGMQILIRKNE
jgi:DNA-binding MarR family transcriptional regulator